MTSNFFSVLLNIYMKFGLPKLFKKSRGFTLIELLVVIAVLGVLAAIVIAAVNPVEQLARGRDASRTSGVVSLGKALQNYYTQKGAWPDVATWDTDLTTTTKELNVFPVVPSGVATGCTATAGEADLAGANSGTAGSGYCYKADAATSVTTNVLYTALESTAQKSKCPLASPVAWMTWSSADGKAGATCTATGSEPAPGSQTFY